MTKKFIFCFLLFNLAAHMDASVCKAQSLKEKHFQAAVDKLIAKAHKTVRPNATGAPAVVDISIHFVRLDEIKTIEESFTSDIFLRLSWNDSRLCHNETDDIVIPGHAAHNVWSPDVYFANALKSSKHEVLKDNHYARISPKGEMLSSTRVTIVARCSQDLTYFPIDSQHCQLIIESYSYTVKHLQTKWKKDSPVTFDSKSMPQFTIGGMGISSRNFRYSTGLFSQVVVKIKLDRRIGYYLIQVFLPCVIVVILSWMTFWMNPENIGDRTALGITSVLTIVLLMGSINNDLPKVSYVKAIDVYLIGCFMYVFAVVLETIIAHHLSKKVQTEGTANDPTKQARKKWRIKGIKRKRNVAAYNFRKENGITEKSTVKVTESMGSKAMKQQKFTSIDSYCRVFFPAFFVFLNISYWVYCVYKSDDKQHTK